MAPKKLPGGMKDGSSGNLHGLGVLGTGQGLPSCLGNPGEMEQDDMLMSTKSLSFIVFTIHTGDQIDIDMKWFYDNWTVYFRTTCQFLLLLTTGRWVF